MSDKFSRMFAEYSAGLRYEDVPPESAHEVKRRILDNIGVSMAAFSEDARRQRGFTPTTSSSRAALRYGGRLCGLLRRRRLSRMD